MDFSDSNIPTTAELVSLYDSVGWSTYTKHPQSLAAAIAGSTFVVTVRQENHLVGLARGLSDDVSIFYLQDVLVRPSRQQQGLGYQLVKRCLDRFDHVRQRVLLTDDEAHQHKLYRSLGFTDLAATSGTPLHAFVSIAGDELG